MRLEDHPLVRRVREQMKKEAHPRPKTLEAGELRRLLLEAGADDVGFVELDRPELEDQREDLSKVLPGAKSLVSFVVRMNRSAIRSPARSLANLEFHHTGDAINEIGRKMVRILEDRGVTALNPPMGFPMEMDRFPDKIWIISHKPVAVAAGLGVMGIHRNVIHPKFGNFILLGSLILDAEISEYGRPLAYNPCLECKLCVAACPVGAIGPDGYFNFNACYTHNYREFMGGFSDWTEQVVESKDRKAYRKRVLDTESASMWQSLSFGPNYKAAYCLSVCPAGEEVLPPYLADKQQFMADYLRPLRDREELVYVVPGSDAEAQVPKRFPRKKVKKVQGTLRPRTIGQFIRGLPLVFQPGRAGDLDAVYHFTFRGAERREVTVIIREQRVQVSEGHSHKPSLRVTADTQTWLGFLAKERNLPWALLTRKIRIHGNPRLLLRFGRCFPS